MSTRAATVHASIKRAFLEKGGTQEQWAKVSADPRKFNLAWRRLLRLPDSTSPPPDAWRNVDPSTGEIILDQEGAICPYCGEPDCEDSCTAAIISKSRQCLSAPLSTACTCNHPRGRGYGQP